jgi:transcriptional regulator with XRE-family HTH domain
MDAGADSRSDSAMASIDDDLDLSEHAGDFAAALRKWRRARNVSQLDLALEAGVSARHLSFLETGRARPSREMALALAEALLLPRGARNAFLQQAGFAPAYPVTPLDAAALSPFRTAMIEMMQRHAPFPAILCNRQWTILDANEPARALLAPLLSAGGDMNVIRMLAESPLAAELIVNLGEVLAEMTDRVRLEALEAGDDPALAALLAALEKARTRHPVFGQGMRRPLAPLIVRTPGPELRFLTAVAQFGASEDVTIRDLRLELFFPADDVTRAALTRA